MNNCSAINKTFCRLSLMILTLLLASCHTTKKVPAGGFWGSNAAQKRFEHLVQSSFKYEALTSKVKYQMGSMSLGGKMCVESDKRVCLQVNAPLIGFEVARIEAGQDNVLLVDKYDKIYTNLDLSTLYDIEELRGHELEALECLMLGRIFIPGKGQATARDYNKFGWSTSKAVDGKSGNSEATYKGKDYTVVYTINAQGQLISTLLTVGSKTAYWEYVDYVEVEKGKWIPTSERISLHNGDGKDVNAGITFSNPQLGESNWRDFEATGSFREASIEDLGKAIKSIAK